MSGNEARKHMRGGAWIDTEGVQVLHTQEPVLEGMVGQSKCLIFSKATTRQCVYS